MNFMHPRSKVFILAALFSGHLFAQDATPALDKDQQAVLARAVEITTNIYSDSQKNALTAIAMKRNCLKTYPDLKGKIDAVFSSDKSGFDQKTRDAIKKLEASKDPYAKGQIDGASIVTYDKELMESGCKALAGTTP